MNLCDDFEICDLTNFKIITLETGLERSHMSIKPCRECKSQINSDAKICPQCGAANPIKGVWAPLTSDTAKVVLFVVLVGWMVFQIVGEDDPLKKTQQDIRTVTQDESPPRPTDTMDAVQSQLQAKAMWVVQVLRSASKAQTCGLRGHMWETRMVDQVFSNAKKEQERLRTMSSNTKGFDDYAKKLEDWEMKHVLPKPPSEYECAAMSRGPEIDMLIKVDADLKEKH